MKLQTKIRDDLDDDFQRFLESIEWMRSRQNEKLNVCLAGGWSHCEIKTLFSAMAGRCVSCGRYK